MIARGYRRACLDLAFRVDCRVIDVRCVISDVKTPLAFITDCIAKAYCATIALFCCPLDSVVVTTIGAWVQSN